MTIKVQADDKVLDVEIRVDVDGYITFAVWDGMKRLSYQMPLMTPFEAGRLGRELIRAADKVGAAGRSEHP